MLHAALLLLMLEAVHTVLVSTISLKRSTQNLPLSTSCRPITPSFPPLLEDEQASRKNRSEWPEISGANMTRQVDVLIVGGGPFGLMLSNELGRRGVTAALFDQKPSTAFNPQANATQARTMEHYRRLGFADEIRSMGLPE